MCTAFVRNGNDYICGFNMDINEDAFDWQLHMDESLFAVVMRMDEKLLSQLSQGRLVPPEYTDFANGTLFIQGVGKNGHFGNQLNNLRFSKAQFEISYDCVPLYHLVDSFIRGKNSLRDVENLARSKKVVNLPTGPVHIPDMGMHSLLSDAEGNILIVEPGNGICIPCEKYAVMTNFPVLELPADFAPENFSYYGKDRYDTALSLLRSSGDNFSVRDGLAILDAVKQTGRWGTRVSFVYSRNENAVYYTTEHDFAHVKKHCFD